MKPGSIPLDRELDSLWECLSAPELERLKAIVKILPKFDDTTATDLCETFRQAATSLPLVAEAINSCPVAGAKTFLGGQERNSETLIDALCRSDVSVEFTIPTIAIFGRAFVQAKINFLKAVEHLCSEASEDGKRLATTINDLVGDAVFSKLGEELLSGALTNPSNRIEIKRAAAEKLIHMWNNRLRLSVGEFPSVLLSAWRARRKVRAIFGTLLGVTEVFSLMTAECEPRFINYFARDHATQDEHQAFQEFLFGLAFEELNQVREHMRANKLTMVTPEEVGELLKSSVRPSFFGYPTPDQMYASYYRRRTRAEYRVVSESPGPRKTAEGYLMDAILEEELEGASDEQ